MIIDIDSLPHTGFRGNVAVLEVMLSLERPMTPQQALVRQLSHIDCVRISQTPHRKTSAKLLLQWKPNSGKFLLGTKMVPKQKIQDGAHAEINASGGKC